MLTKPWMPSYRLAMGADRGILVKQDAADEYQRAVALAAAIKDENPDLILAGHVAADDGSSQVPTRIAEFWDYRM